VALNVKCGRAPTARYVAETTLDAKAKDIRVVVQNAGHRHEVSRRGATADAPVSRPAPQA
jgi:hypothetical protein